MPGWMQALGWGWVAGAALVLGAAVGWYARVPQRGVAAVMALGAGVLISALSFELMDEAQARGGFASTAAGFLGGAVAYTLANRWLAARGAKHRKRSDQRQASEAAQAGSGLAIAVGALLDGVPESMVLGVGLLEGQGVSVVMLAAVFLSNVPEGMSSAAGMRAAGRSVRYVFGVWGAIAFVSGLAALAGHTLLQGVPDALVAATMAVAAGAILAMLVDTMIPEAFATTHDFAGLVTAAGFLAAFALSRLGG